MEYSLPEATIGAKWECVWNGIIRTKFLFITEIHKETIYIQATFTPIIQEMLITSLQLMVYKNTLSVCKVYICVCLIIYPIKN